eukprot:TRINITY_DN27671_c0_g1_i1.p1 TRINITY_DN27671_c0_g1~~TRINITY_DN27671_c0_g1_i1.p1  ORF type:complete len:501 (-),score=113.08 TRINITY_DN27671_c0_g1_i1:3-1436(-)
MPVDVLVCISSFLDVRGLWALCGTCVGFRRNLVLGFRRDLDFDGQVNDKVFSTLKVQLAESKGLYFSHSKLINLQNLSEIEFKFLSKLKFENCKVTQIEPIINLLNSTSTLTSLSLKGCTGLTESKLGLLAQCGAITQLKELNLAATKIADNITGITSKTHNLTHLNLNSCFKIKAVALLDVCKSFSKDVKIKGKVEGKVDSDEIIVENPQTADVRPSQLRVLNFGSLPFLSDDCLKEISISCLFLTELNISKCISLKNESIKAIGKLINLKVLFMCSLKLVDGEFGQLKLPQLEVLNISDNQLTDADLQEITIHAPFLRFLNIGKTRITNEAMNIVAENCKALRLFDLTNCDQITTILPVLQSCKQLEILDLLGCKEIPPSELKLITSSLQFLMKLDVGNCEQIDDDTISTFSQSDTLCIINLKYVTKMSSMSYQYLASLAERIHKTQGRKLKLVLSLKELQEQLKEHPLIVMGNH